MLTALAAAGAAEIVGNAPSVGDGVMGIEPMSGIAPPPCMPGVAPPSELNVGLGCATGSLFAEQAASIAAAIAAVHSATTARCVRRDTTVTSGFR
jgi:hypothetical protein